MSKDSARKMLTKIRRYIRENLGAPFIVGFMFLLIVAAISLLIGFDFLANEIAVYAYYALVVGVVLQLVCFLKYGEKGGDKD
jgi:heme/copper-type cytochrome/quinol oxidase subunit 4